LKRICSERGRERGRGRERERAKERIDRKKDKEFGATFRGSLFPEHRVVGLLTFNKPTIDDN
jgi:hypothetical protein